MIKLNPKGIEHFDYFHIGLVGIHSYQQFWKTLQDVFDNNPLDDTLNDVSAIRIMMQEKRPFKVIDFPHWYDTGNPQSFAHAQKNLK